MRQKNNGFKPYKKYSSWFEKLIYKSIILCVFLYFCCLFYRVIFILLAGDVSSETNAQDYMQMFYNAFWYDGQNIAVISLSFFFIGLMLRYRAKQILNILSMLTILIVSFANIANITFYQIYGDVFNTNLFGLIFDDQSAILDTAMSGQYNLSLKIFTWLFSSAILFGILIFLFSLVDLTHDNRPFQNIQAKGYGAHIALGLFALWSLFAINGQIGFKGISLGSTLKPVQDTFLRKITTGAFRDLYLVYKGYVNIYHSKFEDYSSDSPQETAMKFFGFDKLDSENSQNSESSAALSYDPRQDSEINLEKLLSRRVNNPQGAQVRHIFYIIAESMSQWHFDSEFDELELSAELKMLANSVGGFQANVFLQSAASTIKSLDVHISGMHQTEIPINLMTGIVPTFKTAPAAIFKDLGFETRFFYGGSGTWQKLDSYVISQGFEQIFYNTHIIQNAKTKGYAQPYENTWGAYDHHLFAFIRDKVFINSRRKSFNMIMTTSNHPPYDVDLAQFNAPMERIDNFLAKNPQINKKNITRQLLGHIWYQDKMIAKFIHDTAKRLPNSLFIVTGDHYDREYPKNGGGLRVSNGVPLIVYAPNLRPNIISRTGSHIDITPTLVELSAPHGYQYASFGKPMLNNSIAQDATQVAYGYFSVANDRFIFDGHKVEYFNDALRDDEDKNLADSMLKQLQRAKALSWWILQKGYMIPKQQDMD